MTNQELREMIENGEGQLAKDYAFDLLRKYLGDAWAAGANHDRPAFHTLNRWRETMDLADQIKEEMK